MQFKLLKYFVVECSEVTLSKAYSKLLGFDTN